MTWRAVANAVALAVVLGLGAWELVGVGSSLATNGHLADAASYQAGVLRWIGGDSPYTASQLSGPHTLGSAVGGVGYVYPPTSLPLFLPLVLGVEATLLWVVLTHAAFVAVVFVIARRELAGMPAWVVLMPVLAAIALPGIDEIVFGNASALIATLVGLMWLAPRYASALAVLAGAIKVTPIVGVGWAARWGGSFVAGLVMGSMLLAISLIAGPALWVDWVRAMASAEPSCPEWAVVSVACATGSPLPGFVLAGVMLVGALLAPTRALSFFLFTVAIITPAPDLYQHYLLIPFIGAVPLACRAAVYTRSWAGVGGGAVAGAAA